MIALAHVGMDIATSLFFIGVAGSLLVITISFFEDLYEILHKE